MISLFAPSTADIANAAAATTRHTTDGLTITKCPKCGISERGKLSCCASDGAWRGECGDEDDNQEHTWDEGLKACGSEFTVEAQYMIKRNNNDSSSGNLLLSTVQVDFEDHVNTIDYNGASCISAALIDFSILIIMNVILS